METSAPTVRALDHEVAELRAANAELIDWMAEILPFVLDDTLEAVRTDGGPMLDRRALGQMTADLIEKHGG